MSLIEGAPSGYHGWGAGPGPTGLRNSPGVTGKPGMGPRAINISHQALIVTTGSPQQLTPLFVPEGSLVSLRAHNGTDNGNQHIIRVADHPELLTGSLGTVITPDSEISWPCDNTGQIWVAGTASDGVQIKIQRGRQG